jgi:hypothetical protein
MKGAQAIASEGYGEQERLVVILANPWGSQLSQVYLVLIMKV